MIERMKQALEAVPFDPVETYLNRRAIAAIEAMREPTHLMLVRASDTLGKPPKDLPTIWRDMINAALENSERD